MRFGLGRKTAGITRHNSGIAQAFQRGQERRPQRFNRQNVIEQLFQIVRSMNGERRFVQPRLEIFLDALLRVETDGRPQRLFALPRQDVDDGKILLGTANESNNSTQLMPLADLLGSYVLSEPVNRPPIEQELDRLVTASLVGRDR